MKYRVMEQLNYRYVGDDLVAAIEQFDRFAIGAMIEEDVHQITQEPMIMALSPDDGDLIGTLYGATKEEYDDATRPRN